MARATMYREPLERYLLSKLPLEWPVRVKKIKVRRLDEAGETCNWVVERTEPVLSAELADLLNRDVIQPVRETINVAD